MAKAKLKKKKGIQSGKNDQIALLYQALGLDRLDQ